MPNWCDNNLTLTHDDPVMIDRAVKAFADGKFLNEFIPIPEALNKTTSPNKDNPEELEVKYGYSDWYAFCAAEWGTKWDVGAEQVDRLDNNNINVWFQSAWAPPTEAYAKLEGLGFKIHAFYHEPGMAYAGMYADGEDETYDYGGMTADEIRDMLPEEIDEMFNISEDVKQWLEQEME